MFQRYWIIAVAFGLIALSGQAQEQAQSPERDTGQQQAPADNPSFAIPVEIIEDQAAADTRERREAEADNREVEDLRAQQGMNAATQAMNDATQRIAKYSFWSTIFVAVGTGLLVATLLLTLQANRAARAGAKAAKDANDIIRRENRAWLSTAGLRSMTSPDGQVVQQIILNNSGGSPALNIRATTGYRLTGRNDPLPEIVEKRSKDESNLSIGPSMTTHFTQAKLTSEEIGRLVNKDASIYVSGTIKYDTVVEELTGEVSYFMRLHLERIDRDKDGNKLYVLGGTFLGPHNDIR